MKNIKEIVLFHISLFITCFVVTVTEEEQFKLDIDACWNQHEQIMGNLKNNFKKSVSASKKESKKYSESQKEEKEKSSELMYKRDDVQAEVIKKTKAKDELVEQVKKYIEDITVESQVEIPKKSRVIRSKSLQRVELELKELT